MLISYRDTPHPAIGVTPYEAMHGRPTRTRLDHDAVRETNQREKDRTIEEHDKEYKKRMTQLKRNAKEHKFALKDYVLLKQKKINKWTIAFEPAFYIITNIQGSSITIKRIKDGRELRRDASQLKPANSLLKMDKYPTQAADKAEGEESTSDRETDDERAGGDAEQMKPPQEQEIEGERDIRPGRERRLPVRLRDCILS